MKHKHVMLQWLTCLCLLFAAFAPMAQAYTLSLEATTNGSTVATSFSPGQYIYLNIVSSSTTNIAGCAFTVEYNADVLEPPAIDGDGLSADGITSTLFTLFTDSRNPPGTPATAIPMRAGAPSATTGMAKIALSGATIDTTTGGAKTNLGILFTLKFRVKPAAAFGGPFGFNLIATTLNNTAAGYPAEGAAVPLLVGANPKGDGQSASWTDLTQAFPVLLATLGGAVTTNYSVVEASTKVTGTVTYGGYQKGTLKVGLYSDAALTQFVKGQDLTWSRTTVTSGDMSKNFEIAGVANGTYYLGAFIDSNGNGSQDASEANGKQTTAVVVNSADSSGNAIALADPLHTNGEPLYYYNWKQSNAAWNNIGAMLSDADGDGYPNIQEYINQQNGLGGYSPVVTDASGGPGYTETDPTPAQGVRTHGSSYAPGGNVEVTVRITYTGAITALGVSETIPAGWKFVSVSGTNVPPVKPSVNATGPLSFAWITPPDSPVEFKYTVSVPSDESGTKNFNGEVLYRRTGGEIRVAIPQTSVEKKSYHSADYNQADWSINLSELLRLIQIFNVGSYHCDATGEDGYALGIGSTSCTPHNADYNTQDWSINLSELLRIIQIFNVGAYHPDASGEDGYALGAQ